MMKVYVLCSYWWDDYVVLNVYRNRDDAQQALDALSVGSERGFEILEMELL